MTSIDQFTIDIALTEKGDIDPMKVIEEVFKYINKIKSERPREFVHLELQKMAQINFDYKTKSSAIQYAQALSGRLTKTKEEDVEDILWRPNSYEQWMPDEVQRRLDLLTPDKFWAVYQSKLIEQQETDF